MVLVLVLVKLDKVGEVGPPVNCKYPPIDDPRLFDLGYFTLESLSGLVVVPGAYLACIIGNHLIFLVPQRQKEEISFPLSPPLASFQ